MSSYDADVIIVGAGPAGSLAAYELATKGVRVLILEKSQFPRYKICGGGVTHKTLSEIPFDIKPVIESTIHSIHFSHLFNEAFTCTSADPIMYCTMRSDLDAFLLDQAIKAGANVQMNEHVWEIKENDDEIVVSTMKRDFRSKLLIGAEGASSIVARTFKLWDHISSGLAWEAEISTDPALVSVFSETVFLDWGTFPGGYGWAFPKKDHFSIGVGGPATLSHLMMPYYDKFIDHFMKSLKTVGDAGKQNKPGLPEYQTISLKSWPIPVRTSKSSFHHGSVLITGDAAGLTDPLTGEGIYYAIRSGKLAAKSCHDFLSGKPDAMALYSDRVNDELMSELLEANKIKNLFNVFPKRIHHFVKDSDRAWSAFVKILRGERWYADVRNGFGKMKPFWNIICAVSGWNEKGKERRLSWQKKKTHRR